MAERLKGIRRCRQAVGQKDVPLCDIIGAKLNEYSDGQILKELLQNAEDGGATELTLTIDCRKFATDTILREGSGKWNDDFEVCQGPALLAWNDSSFTEKDWDSIQLPMRSVKMLDPNTIGKFGLGFLSVYHLTDYPWIISGNRIMVMDTQKTGIFLGESGEKRAGTDFYLSHDWDEISSLHDQFAPFQLLDLCQDSNVEGTFFRFPLRTAPSIISSTIYTTEDDPNAVSLRSLFKAFVEGEEGETLLLFLRSVRKVTLMIHHPNDDAPEQLYQVSVSESNGISRITVINGSETTVTNWKVQLLQGRKQKKSTMALAARMFDNCDDQKSSGYTFCFLPMPFVDENATGLSFHVHGDFSLSENRRSILWPSTDNQHSRKARENIRLLCEVFPAVFLRLLLAIKKESAAPAEERSRRISMLWPNLAKLRSPWEATAGPIFEAVEAECSELFWSPYATKWLTAAEAVFTTTSLEKHFEKFFALAKLPVVPYANGAFLQDYKRINDAHLKVLSPKLFASFLRKDWAAYHNRFSISDSIALLKYVISTGTLTDIEGLKLLPLSDGSLQLFKKRKEELSTIFSDNSSIPQRIFQGLTARFLHPEAVGCLWKIISDGGSQLKKVGFSDVPELVEKVLSTESKISMGYIKELWNFLCRSTMDISIRDMENLDILPLRQLVVSKPYSKMQKKGLVSLKSGTVFLTDRNLSSSECDILEVDLGLTLIKYYPFLDHPKSTNYLLEANTGDNILRALRTRLHHEKIQLQDLNFSKKALSFLLPKLSSASRHLDILADLKLFHQHGSTDMISAAAANRLYISETWSDRIMGIDELSKIVVLALNDLDRRKICEIVGVCEKSPLKILNELKKKLPINEAAVIRTIFAWPKIELQRLSKSLQSLNLCAIARQLNLYFVRHQCEAVAWNMMEFLADFDPKTWVMELSDNIPCANGGLHRPDSLVLKTAIQHCPLLCNPHPQLTRQFIERIGIPQHFDAVQSGVTFLTSLAKIYHGRPLNAIDLQSTIQILSDIEKATETRGEVNPYLLLPDTKSILRPLDSLAYHCDESSLEDHYAVHRQIYPDMARKFGIAVERDLILKKYEHDNGDLGCEFGQEMDLVQRIHRLIEQYHSPNDFIQEFVQNAEDARATTITFIIDERVHNTEQLVTSQLACLQGPAILVYNNAIFTNEDMIGIQKLGIGSKGDDRQKIGRFGSGFNCAYAYSDCPSFISNDSDLCFLDPMRQFVAFNRAKKPGRRFEVNRGFKDNFNGSYESFQMPMTLNGITLQGGTMFRLPLRNRASGIWNEVFSSGSIASVLKAARNDAMRMLLFLTSVQQINAYRITNLGVAVPFWESVVSSRIDVVQNNDVSLLRFHENLRVAAVSGLELVRMSVVKNTTMSLISGKCYTEKTETCEQWMISTRLGFESSELVNHDRCFLGIKLLPLGSVAKIISRNGKAVDICPDQIFVSLPLPASTGLPVSLHGHFCLDSEGRKNFWTSCNNEYSDRKLWNEAILSEVLAPAYVDLLEHLTPLVNRQLKDKGLVSLDMFWKTFPDKLNAKTEEWGKFGVSVYEVAVKRCAVIIPNADRIGWMAPIRDNEQCTLFTSVRQIPAQRFNFFVRIGMSLPQKCPLYVVKQFVDLGCRTVSSDDVISILRTEPERVCLQGHHLPTYVTNTEFYFVARQHADKSMSYVDEDMKIRNTVDLVEDIFSYIVASSATKQPKTSLSGIPLLITHDLQVRKFGGKVFKPKTDNEHSIPDLFPFSQDRFAHKSVAVRWQSLRTEEEFLVNVVPKDVAALLESFPAARQREQDDYQLYQNSCLTENADEGWLRNFWHVMLDICDADDMRSELEPIANWNLIPTKVSGRSGIFLFSLTLQDRVLSHELKLKLSELPSGLPYEQGCLYSSACDKNNLDQFLRGVCVNSVSGLIRALGFWKDSLEWSQDSAQALRDYLNSMLKQMRTSAKEAIKRIPIFNTETGSLVSIDHKEALFRRLHSAVPKNGAEFWSCGDALFVKHDERIAELYKWLGIGEMDDRMLVHRFVIPALPNMKPQDQVEHLEFIRYKYSTSPEQWEESIQDLARTPFVLGSRLISEFFDREEKLFQLMEDDEDFLPTDLQDALDTLMHNDWRSFFRSLGFVASPSGEQLLSYAMKIAEIDLNKMDEIDLKCRVVLQSLSDLDERSQALIFAAQCSKIFNIAFVPSGLLDDKYQSLFPVSRSPQLVKISESPRFSDRALIWSTHPFLPKWTDEERICNLLQNYSSFKLDLSDVVQHASIVLSRLKPAKDMERSCLGINADDCIETLQSFVRTLYLKLDSNFEKLGSSMEILQKIPMIPVERGTRLMVPTMVIRKLENDIPPFLYALPDDLKPFKKLLEQIGTIKLPETRHFTSVLESLFQTSLNLDNPNVAKGIQSAQDGLVHLDTQNWEHIKRVYLLTRQNTLMLSCDLIFKDEGKFPDDGGTLSYWSHPNCEIKRVIDFVETMPQHLMPQSYSGTVERVLDTDISKACPLEQCQISSNLELLLKSEQFFDALQRIYYKAKGEMGPMSAWVLGREFLNSLTVKCYERVAVAEKISGHSVSAVPKNRPVYTSANTIYLEHTAMNCSKVSVTVEISEFLENQLPLRNCEKSTVLLLPLLECSPDVILHFLAEKEVPELPGPGASALSLGSTLPAKLIELLISGPALFFVKGELVGYEVRDGPDGLSIILAEIIQVKCSERLKGIYRIKFGEETDCVCDVSALDLFQFRSEAKHLFAELVSVGSPQVVTPDAEEIFAEMNQLEEVKIEVTNMMEEAWKLPVEERRKAIKRIMLAWHPDKNRHRMELATEVFKHIQAQLNRLGNGTTTMENDFNTYYQRWSRAEGRSQSNEYHWYSPRRNPILGKKYFSQAEENLKTAQNMGENCGSDSAVFMVHQAVELALKGLIISETGNISQSHCLYSLASEALSSHDGDQAERFVLELNNKCNTEYMRMIYPKEGLDIPHRLYAQTHRQHALEYGQKIIDHLRPLYS